MLHFDYETVVDGRKLARPVNYALVRIVPPEGVTVDPKRRPYVIIDPRAGHGPGIGGFKDDSQVGVALREGHPVYFVIFFRDPEPGQTLLDVCEAEKQFVHKVRELHPDSAKPAIVGNCQGGWAAMMLAAADPDDTGPIVINGAPMSYWGGAWQEGAGDNPMRYAGGMLGGTWLASLAADHGRRHVRRRVPGRELREPQPGQHVLGQVLPPVRERRHRAAALSRVRALVGRLLPDEPRGDRVDHAQSLRRQQAVERRHEGARPARRSTCATIKAPIILFASMGDNITPPQQAFNWVADVYGSTEEIKARGQVIVGLVHEDVGHLGIFVSGKVAKKEHAQIVSVLKSIETLPPGLYAMEINERKGRDGKVEYEVEFRERRLEDIVARLNRFERADEKPFEAVAAISEFNQRAYELFLQPLVQSTSNEFTAKLRRQFHPLRFQRWAMSDLNPWLGWLGPAAEMVKAQRQSVGDGQRRAARSRRSRRRRSARRSSTTARVRDAASEAAFFQTYGNVFSLYIADKRAGATRRRCEQIDRAARAAVRQGGARVDRGRRLSRGARARRVPARAQGRAAAAVAAADEAGADRPTTAICCPRCRPTSGAAFAASRRSSCATSRSRRSRRCRSCSRDPRRSREARHARAAAPRRRARAAREAVDASSSRWSSTSAKRWRSYRSAAPVAGSTAGQEQVSPQARVASER